MSVDLLTVGPLAPADIRMKKPRQSRVSKAQATSTIKRAKVVFTLQKEVASSLSNAAVGRTYVAIAPFSWAKDRDPVRAIRMARQTIPKNALVPVNSRQIILYEAPEGTRIDAFNGALLPPAGSTVLLVAELKR